MTVTFDSVREIMKDSATNPSDRASAKALQEINAYLKENSATAAQKAEAEKKVTALFGELKIDLDGDGDPSDERVEFDGDNVVIKHKDNKSGQEIAYADSAKALKGEYRMSAAADPALTKQLEGLSEKPIPDSKIVTNLDEKQNVIGFQPLGGKYGADKPAWTKNPESGEWFEENERGDKIPLAGPPKFAANGDVIVTHKNGHIDVRSEDGTIKKYSSDKTLREVFPGDCYARDGNHWVKENGKWYQVNGDSRVECKDVHVRENGDIVVTQDDGRIEVRTKDGEIFKYKPDGTLYEVWRKDGSSWNAEQEGAPVLEDDLRKRSQEHAPTQDELKINNPDTTATDRKPTATPPAPTDGGGDPPRTDAASTEPKMEEVGRHKIKLETNGDENSAVVKKGDNLWWIAEAWIKKNKGEDYKPDAKEVWAVINEIKKLNEDKVGKNYVIQPETKLKLPPLEKESEEEEGSGDGDKKPEQKQLLSERASQLLKAAHEQLDAEPKDGIITADELNNKICELDKEAAELEKKESKTAKEQEKLKALKEKLERYKELMVNWQKLAKSQTKDGEPGFSLADLERYVEEQIKERAAKN